MRTARSVVLALVVGIGSIAVGAGSTSVGAAPIGQFVASARPPTGLRSATTVALPGGRALVVGGQADAGVRRAALLFDATAETLTETAPMIATDRYSPIAALQPDGRVMVNGGRSVCGPSLDSTEFYDPATDSWAAGPSMVAPRESPMWVAFPDGRVWSGGGEIYGSTCLGTPTATTEMFDPVTSTWSSRAPMHAGLAGGHAVALADGRILVAGGGTGTGAAPVYSTTANVYDPVSNTWAPAGSMSEVHLGGDAVLLADGRVIVVGGQPEPLTQRAGTSTVDVYDPTTNSWSTAAHTQLGRSSEDLVVTAGGLVLLLGGIGSDFYPVTTTEVYDPVADTWTLDASYPGPSTQTDGLILLSDSRVWVSDHSYFWYAPGVDPVDHTSPIASFVSPSAAQEFSLGAVIASSYSCADELHAVISCVGTVPVGAAVPTGVAGPQTFSVVAADDRGNTSAPQTVTYIVRAGDVSGLLPDARTHLSISTDPNGLGASPAVPWQTTVTDVEVQQRCFGNRTFTVTPSAGATPPAPAGATALSGAWIDVTGGAGVCVQTGGVPLGVHFQIDGSVIGASATRDLRLVFVRSGTPSIVPPCDATSSVTPCVASLAVVGGDVDIVVRATSLAGATRAVLATVALGVDGTPPTIDLPDPDGVRQIRVGDTVAASFSCLDDIYGAGIAVCRASHGGSVADAPAGLVLDTSTPGTFTMSVLARDLDGNESTATATYRVLPLAPAYTATDIGSLGGTSVIVAGINDAGMVVGSSSLLGDLGEQHAFAWTAATGMIDLGTLGGTVSSALAVGPNGRVVGYSAVAGDGAYHAFMWTAATGMVDVGSMGGSSAQAIDVNASGQVVGTALLPDNNTNVGFFWSAATGMIPIAGADGSATFPVAINDAGEVTGGLYRPDGSYDAFRWTRFGGMQDLDPGASYTGSNGTGITESGVVWGRAYRNGMAVPVAALPGGPLVEIGPVDQQGATTGGNASNQVIGWSSPPAGFPAPGFVWSPADGLMQLPTLGGSYATPQGINDSGAVVGSASLAGDAEFHAFVWEPSFGIVDLGGVAADQQSNAIAINANGLIAGTSDPTGGGVVHGVVWTPPTVPDGDGDHDGVVDTIDSGNGAFTDAVAGAPDTVGSIVDVPSGLVVAITDAPDPDGVQVTVTGSGTAKVTLSVCGFATVRVAAGSSITLTCGSVMVAVQQGSAEVLVGAGGSTTLSLSTGATAKVSQTAGETFVVANLGSVPVSVVSNGHPSTIGGGQSSTVNDLTAPTATPTISPAANAAGWRRSSPTVTWNWNDGTGVGVDPVHCATSSTSTSDGAAVVVSSTCADLAGNVGSASVTVKVDRTAPVVTCPASTDVVLETTGATLTAPVSDATSGVPAPTVSVPLVTTAAGARTVAVTATDRAGNSTTTQCAYRVVYRVVWLVPLGGPGSYRSMAKNTTVPFTFELTDARGRGVSAAAVTAPTSVAVTCPSGTPSPLASLNVAASTVKVGGGWWIAGWRADSSFRNTCRRVTIAIGDGTTIQTVVRVT